MYKINSIIFIIVLFSFSLICSGGEIVGVRPEAAGVYTNDEFKLVVNPPIGEYNFYRRAVFFNIPGALCEYANTNTRVTYTLFALKINKPASYIGKYIRFHVTGRATDVEIIEDGVWMLKKNAITLQQRYQFFINHKLFYMTVYIMYHKRDNDRKAALLVSCPFESFAGIKEYAYQAYLDFNFTD